MIEPKEEKANQGPAEAQAGMAGVLNNLRAVMPAPDVLAYLATLAAVLAPAIAKAAAGDALFRRPGDVGG